LLLIVLGVIALAFVAAIPIARRHIHAEAEMTYRHGIRVALATLGTVLTGTNGTAALPVPPTTIGVSLSPPGYFRQSRALSNMAIGGNWFVSDHRALGPTDVDRDGVVKQIPAGVKMSRMLTPPNAATKSATIRCTYHGKGVLKPTSKRPQKVRSIPNGFFFEVRNDDVTSDNAIVPLELSAVDPANPLRDLDCRETSMPPTARLDPIFVQSLHGFRVIRFMDWQQSNDDAPVTWATRHTQRSIDVLDGDGVAIEDMIALAQATGAAPWFNMPWNGDDNYFEHFARAVHDGLPADRVVYVEMGNEIWNGMFKASKQATREGLAAGLSDRPREAQLMRYAQRLAHVMDIWARVYADRPGKLVRVAACQNGAGCAKTVLGYRDTAHHVDALATAPYFGAAISRDPASTTPDAVFAKVDDDIDRTLNLALQAKAVAAQYGKRYIAYEAGQHFRFRNAALQRQVQHDPRMYEAYKRYLDLWQTKIGDTIILYSSSGPIAPSGAWGLVEHVGQSDIDAPKMRAVHEAIAASAGGKTAH
jgi:hypothetical protein